MHSIDGLVDELQPAAADAPPTPKRLFVLYRGPLASCNYACTYCPFAKHPETPEEKHFDAEGLMSLVAWAEEQRHLRLNILFTPWGEALVRERYQEAMIELSRLDNVEKVVFQTNLSMKTEFLKRAQVEKIALWCTFHPGEVSRVHFQAKCDELIELGVRYSVGVVGMPGHFEELRSLRAMLPDDIYIWVNALRKGHKVFPYSPQQLAFLREIDPHFGHNIRAYATQGKACSTGETAIAIDGQGNIRRCHFVDEIIGNIADPDWESCLQPRLCPNQICDCHIGYIHLDGLNLHQTFASGILERIPLAW